MNIQNAKTADYKSVTVQSHRHDSAVVDVYFSCLLGMLAQNTNVGSDSVARVNPSGILCSLLHSARHDLGDC